METMLPLTLSMGLVHRTEHFNTDMQDFLLEIAELSGLPLAPQAGLPETNEELDIYMQLNYKQASEISMEQGIDLAFYLNNQIQVPTYVTNASKGKKS